MNYRQKKKKIKNENRILIERYPFLIPRNWEGDIPKNYNYLYTKLDDMPRGWKKSFGVIMCEELREILLKENMLDDYYFSEVKEKYGRLCIYDNGSNRELQDILLKYEYISEHICIICGKFDVTLFDDGWVCPYCDNCFIERKKEEHYRYLDYNERKENPFNKDKAMKFKLDDEPLQTSIHMESMGKNGCKHWDIDLTETINKIRKRNL